MNMIKPVKMVMVILVVDRVPLQQKINKHYYHCLKGNKCVLKMLEHMLVRCVYLGSPLSPVPSLALPSSFLSPASSVQESQVALLQQKNGGRTQDPGP